MAARLQPNALFSSRLTPGFTWMLCGCERLTRSCDWSQLQCDLNSGFLNERLSFKHPASKTGSCCSRSQVSLQPRTSVGQNLHHVRDTCSCIKQLNRLRLRVGVFSVGMRADGVTPVDQKPQAERQVDRRLRLLRRGAPRVLTDARRSCYSSAEHCREQI